MPTIVTEGEEEWADVDGCSAVFWAVESDGAEPAAPVGAAHPSEISIVVEDLTTAAATAAGHGLHSQMYLGPTRFWRSNKVIKFSNTSGHPVRVWIHQVAYKTYLVGETTSGGVGGGGGAPGMPVTVNVTGSHQQVWKALRNTNGPPAKLTIHPRPAPPIHPGVTNVGQTMSVTAAYEFIDPSQGPLYRVVCEDVQVWPKQHVKIEPIDYTPVQCYCPVRNF
jgi:hypothetical protein